jgi:glycosyltransferase involved in cell wall biosynthesis
VKLLVDARTGWGHGIGRVIVNTIPRVARSRPTWQIDVLVLPKDCAAARYAFDEVANLTVIECPIDPFSLSEQTSLFRYARGYTLTWFTNYWVPLGWSGAFVVTVHDMLHLIPHLFPASVPKRVLSRRTFSKIRRDARAIMFDSRFTEEAFTHLVGPPRHSVTVQLGGDHLDYGLLRPVRARSRRLLVVAAAKQHKNFDLLFAAWQAAQVASHWTLTIISPNSMMRSSVDIDDMSQKARVEIRRGVSNEELAALYADSAVLLMPSLYEGFGLPLLEGMLAGALCVSSNAGAMIEVAEGAFVQFVNGTDQVGWTQAIENVCAIIDGETVDTDVITRHNIACARRFQWDTTATQVSTVIEDAANMAADRPNNIKVQEIK